MTTPEVGGERPESGTVAAQKAGRDESRPVGGTAATARRPPWGASIPLLVLAVLAYVPALRSSPGRMPADTKLYLYLDPGRLIADAPWTFDARQFAGWVPHQVIAYLWPQGPWFWLGDRVGLPDWVTHRLWLGTLFFAGGAGVLWAARRLGLGLAAAFAAAVVYQVSPYVLPYVSRTSAMLLPWAGMGWIVGLTVLAATRSRWRHAALAALVVVTVGAVNATALLMIVPAPALWLLVAAVDGTISWRRAGATAGRIGGLCLAVSLWWIAMVSIQGRSGADVLTFSESLRSVSHTSTAPEVWRGMGYWLDYVRDPFLATTTAALDHMTSGRVVVANFAVVVLGVVGSAATRWRSWRYAIALVATGVVLGTGVHPLEDPSPVMDALVGDGTSGAALALRSSTRAVPVLVLGLGLGIGALVDAGGRWAAARRVRTGAAPHATGAVVRIVGAGLVGLLVLVGLPSLTSARLVDPALVRDEDPPAAWREAAAALDASPAGTRVLQLPGQEFGAFRWGYTVDPPLPGLIGRPLVTRDLLPLGSAPAMDLLYALDDRFQAGTVEGDEIAPVARLLGADTVWVTGDAAFERFRTPRPELTAALFAGAPRGLGEPRLFGAPVVNRPDRPMVDEQTLGDDRVGTPVAPVALVPVEDPVPVVRAKDDVVLLTGSGDGVVDAAAAGILDGHELVRYTGSLAPDGAAAAVGGASRVIVTDSNRDRAHHWRSSQDVSGFTESAAVDGPDVLRVDEADERLAVFGAQAAVTDAVQEGPVTARATTYGEPFAYRPENRPFMAIDGDPATAWVAGDRADPVGEQLRLDVTEPVDHVSLRQPLGAEAVRHLAAVTVTVDGGEPIAVELDQRSFAEGGQRVELPTTNGPAAVTITIESVAVPDPTIGPALAAVGFAEADVGLGPTSEVVRVPDDLGDAMGADTPLTYVFTRLRTRPSDRWRSDAEPTLAREWDQAGIRTFAPELTVRLDQRAGDAVLAGLLGVDGAVASERLTGVTAAAGWAATDGDPHTAWRTAFGGGVGASLEVVTEEPTTTFTLTQPAGDVSPISAVRVSGAGVVVDADVPAPDADGTSIVVLSEPVPAGATRVEIIAVEPVTTIDRRYSEPVVLPAAIAEISLGARTAVPGTLDTGCRDDLVAVDGDPIAVRVTGDVGDLLAGAPATVEPCGEPLALDEGTHRLVTTTGNGLQIDRVVLDDGGRAASATTPVGAAGGPSATVTESGRLQRTITVDDCPEGCWLVLGEGFSEEWAASIDDVSLGAPQLVDGGFNGWWVPPSHGPTVVHVSWQAQRPLTVALVLTVLAVLACVALAVLDRRRRPDAAAEFVEEPPAFEPLGAPVPMRRRLVAVGVWAVAGGLLVAPGWALVALVAGAVLVVATGRPRLAAWATAGMLVAVAAQVAWVVARQHPWADAGWPVRFEHLHHVGVFAALSLLVAVFATGRPPSRIRDDRRPVGRSGRSPPR